MDIEWLVCNRTHDEKDDWVTCGKRKKWFVKYGPAGTWKRNSAMSYDNMKKDTRSAGQAFFLQLLLRL